MGVSTRRYRYLSPVYSNFSQEAFIHHHITTLRLNLLPRAMKRQYLPQTLARVEQLGSFSFQLNATQFKKPDARRHCSSEWPSLPGHRDIAVCHCSLSRHIHPHQRELGVIRSFPMHRAHVARTVHVVASSDTNRSIHCCHHLCHARPTSPQLFGVRSSEHVWLEEICKSEVVARGDPYPTVARLCM